MIHIRESSADFSTCGLYRYSLRRVWSPGERLVLFVGLNPSTADGERDDPTIRRCIGYARHWGYGGVVVANLFAYRATQPRDLLAAENPIGPRNDEALAHSQKEAARVVVAWGNHGDFLGRGREVLEMIKAPYCLGVNQNGSPKHPLYLKGDQMPMRYHE